MNEEDRISFHLDKTDALERVSELVHARLVDCGWRDKVRYACRKSIMENGEQTLTVDELINNVTGKARSLVPDLVKRELLHELENIIVNVDKTNFDVKRNRK